MSEPIQAAVEALKQSYGAEHIVQRGDSWLVVTPDRLVPAMTTLRDDFEFDFLCCLTASDYYPQQEPRFHVVYQLYSYHHGKRIGLRVPISGSNPEVPTVEGVFPVANWHEREVFDLFGIKFSGHSDLRRILMPYDWEGHPLRKDYPLGYEEPQFTFNFDDIQRRKHRARYEEA